MPVSRDESPDIRAAATLLFALLVADVAFVLAHYLWTTGVLGDALFSLEKDRGYPEHFQYMKVLSIVIMLLLVTFRTKMIGYGVWSLLFFYLLLDDALQIHEAFGVYLASSFEFAPAIGLRAVDFGELAVSGIAAIVFLVSLAFIYVSETGGFRMASRHLLLLLFALAFFGIFVDMLHVAVDMGWRVTWLLGVIEDGGEMVAISLMASYVFLLNARGGDIRFVANEHGSDEDG
jgi:hypothetical protein